MANQAGGQAAGDPLGGPSPSVRGPLHGQDFHALARCCWCTGRFWWSEAGQAWLCETRACAERQWKHAVFGAPQGKGKARRALFVPTPKQVEFIACRATYRLFGGAAGGAKSHGIRWDLYRDCQRLPNLECLILRKTYPELEKTHLRRMAREAPLIGAEYTDSKRIIKFPNGSFIEAGHLDDEEALTRYLSTEYDRIRVDEGSTMDGDFLLELSTRARTPKRADKQAILDKGGANYGIGSNPGGMGALFLKDFFIDHNVDFDKHPALAPGEPDAYVADEWVFLPSLLEDNPYLDEKYARALAVLPEVRRRQLRHGDWRVSEGQFFSSWNESIHVVDLGRLGPELRWFCSLDWGYNAPGCCLWWVCLPDGHFYIAWEYKFNGQTTERVTVKEVAAEIKRRSVAFGLKKAPMVAADPAIWQKTGQVGESIADTFIRWRVPVHKSNNERVNGWQRVHELLRVAPDGQPWLMVHPSCRYLIRTVPALVMSERDPDDVDTDGDDHAADALRYGAMSWPSARALGSSGKTKEGTIGWYVSRSEKPKGILSAHA